MRTVLLGRLTPRAVGGLALVLSLIMVVSSMDAAPLDEEARAEGERYYASKLTKCGEDHYLRWLWAYHKIPFWEQYKGMTVKAEPYQITPADRLNGLEWSGIIFIAAEAHRSRDERQQSWSPWGNGAGNDLRATVQKRQGVWTIEVQARYLPWNDGSINAKNAWERTTRIDCARIPK